MLPLTRPLVILHDPSRSPRQLWNQTQRQPKFIPRLSNKPRSTSALGTMKHAQRIVILQVVVSFVRSLRSAVPKNGSHLELGRHHGGQEQHNSWGASFTQYAVSNSTSTEMQSTPKTQCQPPDHLFFSLPREMRDEIYHNVFLQHRYMLRFSPPHFLKEAVAPHLFNRQGQR
jgi:hypothetical protein